MEWDYNSLTGEIWMYRQNDHIIWKYLTELCEVEMELYKNGGDSVGIIQPKSVKQEWINNALQYSITTYKVIKVEGDEFTFEPDKNNTYYNQLEKTETIKFERDELPEAFEVDLYEDEIDEYGELYVVKDTWNNDEIVELTTDEDVLEKNYLYK